MRPGSKSKDAVLQFKLSLLLAEINICKDKIPVWSEIEALYRYDVLDYTFPYARAQYGYGKGIQDEDGLYVTLIDNPPATSNLLIRSLSDPGSTTTMSRGGRSKRGGAPLPDHLAVDSIARQTGIVDLPTDMIQDIAQYLTPYSALMLTLATKIPLLMKKLRKLSIYYLIHMSSFMFIARIPNGP